jgi:hypothetical protein
VRKEAIFREEGMPKSSKNRVKSKNIAIMPRKGDIILIFESVLFIMFTSQKK